MQSQRLSRWRVASVIGYLILGAYTAIVYVGGFLVSVAHSIGAMIVLGIWVVAFFYESGLEWRLACSATSEEQRFDFPKDSLSFLTLFLGTVITYWISVTLGLGAVTASGLVGVFAAAFLKPYAAPVFSGSFVGMASAGVFDYPTIMLAGAIAGLIFVVGKHVFNGFGGKLGTTAWAGCVFAALIAGSPLTAAPVLGWDVGWPLMAYCVAGAFITFILSVWFGQGPVMASGMVGLAAGLLLPAIHGPAAGGVYAVGVYAASFAGMSGTTRFERAWWMVPSGVLCALILMYTTPFMGGGGGKLGTTAFGAVIGVRGLIDIAGTLRRRLGREETAQDDEAAV